MIKTYHSGPCHQTKMSNKQENTQTNPQGLEVVKASLTEEAVVEILRVEIRDPNRAHQMRREAEAKAAANVPRGPPALPGLGQIEVSQQSKVSMVPTNSQLGRSSSLRSGTVGSTVIMPTPPEGYRRPERSISFITADDDALTERSSFQG
jgi:hypothetical protein